MSFNPDLREIQKKAKIFIDANVWDGEDRQRARYDVAYLNPRQLQEIVDEMLEYLSDEKYI